MNRRSFIRAIALATAGVYLRISPEAANSVPRGIRNSAWDDAEYEVVFLHYRGGFQRLVPKEWDGKDIPIPADFSRFSVRNGIITYE